MKTKVIKIDGGEKLDLFRSTLEKMGWSTLMGFTSEYDDDDIVDTGYAVAADDNTGYFLSKTVQEGEEVIDLDQFIFDTLSTIID